MKRPNEYWHMVKWGSVSGFILAIAYFIMQTDFFNWSNLSKWEILQLIFTPSVWVIGFITGSVPGAIIAIFTGVNLERIVWKIDKLEGTYTPKERLRVYASTFFTTTALFVLLMSCLLLPASMLVTVGRIQWFWITLPVLMAGTAASYAAHRYLFRLGLWRVNMSNRKPKAKNEALSEKHKRLSDHPREDAMINSHSEAKAQSETSS